MSTITKDPAAGEIINIHFEANRKRQGLTCFSSIEFEVDPLSSGEDSTNQNQKSTSAVDDKSRKGSIDERIVKLVQQINNSYTATFLSPSDQSISSLSPSSSVKSTAASVLVNKSWNYFTTSSCSGRAILFTHDEAAAGPASDKPETSEENSQTLATATVATSSSSCSSSSPQIRKTNQKKGCKWLYVTHDEINMEEFFNCWKNLAEGTYAVCKIEPSIFHVQCRTLSSAKELIHIAATLSGFRNSGMVIGKDGKITVAIRSTIGLEVPLPKGTLDGGYPIVTDKFLEYLITTGNQTMHDNWKRTAKLANEFEKHFFPE